MGDAGLDWKRVHADAVARAAPTPPFERDLALLREPLTDLGLARGRAVRRCLAEDALAEFSQQLGAGEGGSRRALREAVQQRDVAAYARAVEALAALRRKQG